MELYNDLKFSGKGLYDIINDDNLYTNQGIIFNSNQDISIQPNSINFKYQPSFNNILHISSNSNIGIGIENPKYPLDVAGSISCFDINISNSILNKDFINTIGFSADDIKEGVLKINNGGVGSISLNQDELLMGDIQQSSFLIWKENERRLGIGISNPLENVDVNGDTNALYYRKDGIDIREIFVKDLSISSNECFINSSNANFINSLNYTNVVKDEVIKYIDSRTIDWIKYGKGINYIYSKVGIGTAEPSSSLYIIGDINYTGQLRRNGVLKKIFYGDYADLENNKGYAWELSNGEVFNLNAGCVGIGSQIPRYNLDIDGGINFQSNMKKNGNIINFFDSDFNKLTNPPTISKFGYSGSFNNLTETPFIFINKYSNLNNIPSVFPANWNTSISNIPTFFPTDWNTLVLNKPEYFLTNWISSIDNKPKSFNVDWDANIFGKPDFFRADWCNIINKPEKFNADWYSNILNIPRFEKVAFTGQYSNILNRPSLFSGFYKDLREKPKYSRIAFTGDYYQLCNLPNLFTGEFSTLSNLPTNFQADWNTTILNKPDFSSVAYSGLYYDTINYPIDNWGEMGNNIYSCNTSNIGIGTTIPQFKFDLRGSLNANDIFTINQNRILIDNKPWGIYFAEDWSGTTLPDSSGNNRNATTSGTINLENSNGNGATSSIFNIKGDTSSTISWPSGSIPSTFTILSLTRYTGGSRGRILQSQTGNLLHGHWGGNRGVCHYDGWKSPYSTIGTLDDWLICIGRNSSTIPNNIIVDGIGRGNATGGNGNYQLGLNLGIGELSDWALGCVIIWDKHLTDNECFKLSDIIKSYLNIGGSLKTFFNIIEINGTSFFNKMNISFVSSNDYYKTSNWNKIFSSNIYNYNSGSIGININNPSSLYKLDVNGLINTTQNFLLNDGINWSSYNTEIRIPKTNNSSYSPSSLIDDLIIRSQINKKIIIGNITNELLFLNSGNIGIGTTNPQSTIHIHNSSSNQEIKINLSTSFFLSKSSNNEGIIWNSNKGISFGTNNLERLSLSITEKSLPWGVYFAGNYSNNTLYDLSGNERHATTTGTITSGNSNGNGATSNIKFISGDVNSTISWPSGSIPNNFTILSLTRYTGGTSRKILVSKKNANDPDWFHGHSGGNRGVCYYQDWKTSTTGISGNGNVNDNDWVCVIGKNGGNIPNNININGVNSGTNTGGTGNLQLGINFPNNDVSFVYLYGFDYNDWLLYYNYGYGDYRSFTRLDLRSDWSLSYVVIWDRHLTDYEIMSNSSLITTYLTNGTEPTFISSLSGEKTQVNISSNITSLNLNNYSSNQEIKINFSGFLIYKSSNHDGYLWNSNNNFIAFGTNNIERIRLNNLGNVGIGTNNPQSIIHIHNSSSNQEIKMNLSTSLSISKNSNNEGIIWNSNKGINFINRLSISSSEELTPWGIYFGGNYSNNILYDLSGNERHATTSGTITSGNSNGNGATSNIKFISGNTSATISWPTGSIPNNFTILTLTRYTGPTRRRIIMAQSGNWLHGHHNGNRGVCYYDGWKTNQTSLGTQDDWLCCIGRNLTTTPNNIIVDGNGIGIASGGTSNIRLSVNIGNGETSDWSLSYVVIWNRHLTDEEVMSNNSLITTYLTNGTEPRFISSSLSGGKTQVNISSSLTSLNIYNSSSNQDVKIDFSGFSIYKMINNDGYLWNSNNNTIAFGTNNIERIRINNLGNVGIGTNNPQSIIHIHNSNSNQEIKMNLSGFSIYKGINNDGYLWNSNKGINFGTNNLDRLFIQNNQTLGNYNPVVYVENSNQPWGMYFAEDWIGTTLPDVSGNNRHATTSGTITKYFGSGNGATNSITYLIGGTSSTISWPPESIPINFTILTLTRYNGGTRRRIIMAQSGNWFQGHWNGNRGVCFYDSWKSPYSTIGTLDDWLICIGRNSSTIPNNIIVDGIGRGNATGGNGNYQLTINIGSGETSDWGLGCVLIWDKHLTDAECFELNSNISNVLLNGGSLKEKFSNLISIIPGGKTNINISSNLTSLNINNYSSRKEIKINLNGFYIFKATNNDGYLWNSNTNLISFGTNNSQKVVITKGQVIGIGVTNVLYKLHVNGTINGIFYGDGSLISNLEFTKITNGILNINNGGLGISNPILNQILIGNGLSNIIQSSNLIWSNNRLGVGISNPSNELDVNQNIRCLNLYGNGSSLTNLQISNITNGRLNVNNGGTGLSNLLANQLLSGNGTNSIISTNIFWNNTTKRLGINLNDINSFNFTLNINDTINGTFRGDGSLISNIDVGNFSSGTLNTSNGGFGVSSFTSGNILIGNTTTPNLFWSNTSNFLGINNSSPSYVLDINGTLKSYNIEGNGSNLTNLNIAIFNTTNILNVNKGGTGKNSITSNKLLTGNGTSSTIIETTNLIWNGTDKLVINSNLFDNNITNNLTIFGDINFTGNITQNGNIYSGTGIKGEWDINGNNIYYNSGSVGINTLSPNTDYKLDVNSNIKCDILKFNQDIDLLSKTLRLNKSQYSGSTIKFNNNTKIDYLYGGAYFDTLQFNTELSSSNSTNTINGFKFEGGRILISATNYSNNFNLNVKVIYNTYYFSNIWLLKIGGFFSSNVIESYSNVGISYIPAYFENHIIIKGSVIGSSDIRIKNNINNINSKYALELISKINPKTFKYIDYLEYGTKNNYGFIAQDVKKLIPEAIEFRKEFIPNIMKIFDINENIIETNEDLTSKLNINDTIQIINKDNKKINYKILEISSNFIKIDKKLENNKYFIYGKEVDDFHNLTKDFIYTLNVSAIKELYKQIKKQKNILKKQDEILKTQEEILMEQERRFEEQEKQIKYLLNIINNEFS